jgi:hypothetical protein
VLGLGYREHAQSSNNSLSRTPWKEVPWFLKGCASQTFERTKMTNQGKSDGFFTHEQSEILNAR